MNILVLNYEYPPIGGGGGSVSKEISELYVEQGHNVKVVTMSFFNLPEHEVVNGVEIFRVKSLRKRKDACKPQEQMTYILSAVRFLKKFLKTNKIDVCHTHFIIPTGPVALWMKKKYHIPYIITAHGSDVPGHNTQKFAILHKMLGGAWKKIVCEASAVVSPSVYLEKLMKKSCDTYKYDIIPNGIQCKYYKSLEKEKYILMLSRLQKLKGVQTVIKAFALVKPIGWRLKIVGDGPYKEELEKMAKEYHVDDQVDFLGWIENKSTQHLRLLGKAYLYISASFFENCPVSVLEAACSGAKLLLSDIEAHHQLIGEEGDYFKADDEKELAEKIEKIIFENGGKAVSNPLEKDWINSIKQYEKLLANAIEKTV